MVFEKIREIIAEQTGKDVEEITLETNVKEDLDADSLDLFQIINDIEDEFDVSVEDPESIVTDQDAVDFVNKKQSISALPAPRLSVPTESALQLWRKT